MRHKTRQMNSMPKYSIAPLIRFGLIEVADNISIYY